MTTERLGEVAKHFSKLTQRDFPSVSRQNIRTSYSYDSAGRL